MSWITGIYQSASITPVYIHKHHSPKKNTLKRKEFKTTTANLLTRMTAVTVLLEQAPRTTKTTCRWRQSKSRNLYLLKPNPVSWKFQYPANALKYYALSKGHIKMFLSVLLITCKMFVVGQTTVWLMLLVDLYGTGQGPHSRGKKDVSTVKSILAALSKDPGSFNS